MNARPIDFPASEISRGHLLWGRFRRHRAATLGFFLLVTLLLMAATASLIAPGDPFAPSGAPMSAPLVDAAVPLGTDALGRDLLAGIVHGARTSLASGMIATIVSLSIGVLLGMLDIMACGRWAGGAVALVERAIRIVPKVLLLLALVAVLGHSMYTVAVAIGLVSWTETARRMRLELGELDRCEFVNAARNLGAGRTALLFRELLPNALPPVLASAPYLMATAILLESALAFLGISDPERMSWGGTLGASREFLPGAWHCALVPGLAILSAALSLELIGEALEESLDPRGSRS